MVTAMAMATESATATETATAIAMATATSRATMTKGWLPLHVPAMCSAVAGAIPCLHPCIHQRCIMGVMLQRVFAPFQGGGFLTAHHGLLFYFLQLLFSLLNNPLFIPCIIQALKNPASPLALYFLHSYFIFLQRKAWARLGLCACNMQRCGRGDATARRSPNPPPPPDTKKGALPSAEP